MIRRGRQALLALVLTALFGCRGTTGFPPPAAQLGPEPYRIGELRVWIRPPREVDILCRMVVDAPPQVEIRGCFIPATKTIISVDDPYIILHELKHYFEGAWHQAP